MCRAELEAGDLVQVLPGFRLNHVDVHAVFPAGHRPSRKLRALTDYLAAAFGITSELAPYGDLKPGLPTRLSSRATFSAWRT
jgi:hypothetical protein